MQLYGALMLLMTLSAACGLMCYSCTAAEPKSCTDIMTCSIFSNRCYTLKVHDVMVTKGCFNSLFCENPVICCEGDLCNSSGPTGPRITLLLSSALLMSFV